VSRLHLPEVLAHCADLIENGLDAPRINSDAERDLAQRLATDRLDRGNELSQVASEFAGLRETIFDFWLDGVEEPIFHEMRSLPQVLDRLLGASLSHYGSALEERDEALDLAFGTLVETQDLDAFLAHLLRTVVGPTRSFDNGAIFVCDDDSTLRLRAACG